MHGIGAQTLAGGGDGLRKNADRGDTLLHAAIGQRLDLRLGLPAFERGQVHQRKQAGGNLGRGFGALRLPDQIVIASHGQPTP